MGHKLQWSWSGGAAQTADNLIMYRHSPRMSPQPAEERGVRGCVKETIYAPHFSRIQSGKLFGTLRLHLPDFLRHYIMLLFSVVLVNGLR